MKQYFECDGHFSAVKAFYAAVLMLLWFAVGDDAAAVSRIDSQIHVANMALQDGLSQNTVTSIVQDTRGYMWLGTQDGLNRFDGYKFKVYQPDPDNPHSLSNNSIWALYVDRGGVLWVGTYTGLNQFDRKTDSFISYHHDPNNIRSLSHDDVRVIYEDSRGVLWIGTHGGGLNAMDRKVDGFTRYQHILADNYSIAGDVVNAVYEDSQGNLWVGTNRGLDRFDRVTQRFLKQRESGMDKPYVITSIYEDSDRQLWVGTEGHGLLVYDSSRQRVRHYVHNPLDEKSLSHNTVLSIYQDRNKLLWFGTDGGGLEQFDRSADRFMHHQHNPNDPYSISENRIVTLYEDRSGAFWIGMYSRGVNLYNRYSFASSLNRNQPVDRSLLNHSYVRAFLVDRDNTLWVGTEGGGVSATDKNGVTRHYRNEIGNSASLSNNLVFSIYEDAAGRIWIGCEGGWLNLLNPKTGRVTRYATQPAAAGSIEHGKIRSILEDRNGNLWVGSDGGGLHAFDRNTGAFKHHHHDEKRADSLSNDRVFSIFQDRQGVVWVSTFGGGLNAIDLETGKFRHYRNNPGDAASLSHDYVMMVSEDEKNNLWVGTYGGGLNLMDRSNHTFKRYAEGAGLPNNAIYGILSDEKGFLWLSHNKGISRFNPVTGVIKNYDIRDGLQSNEFNGGAYYRDFGGKLYFGGLDGYNAFYPDDIHDNPYVPQVVITDFQLFNQSVRVGGKPGERSLLSAVVDETAAITLSHKDQVFSFEFAALSFVQSARNQYAYMLEGFEEKWNHVGSRRFVTYTALPPGDYTFRVKASNNNDVWNEQGTALRIRIEPPLWQTWWFRIAVIVLVLLLIFAFYAMRMRSVKARNAMLREEVQARTAELEIQKASLERTLSELSETRDALVESAHKAGMADTATGVLHNVGNLLNSVNTSVGVMRTMIWQPAAASLYKANELLRANMETLEEFISRNPKGKKLMQYYLELEKSFKTENDALRENTLRLNDKINAIGEAIAAQQQYAKGHNFAEELPLAKVVQETLKFQSSSLDKYKISVVTEFDADIPLVKVQKTKLVQILINLYKNAKESMLECDAQKRVLSIKLCKDADNIYLRVADTGNGVEKAKLADIFAYGFSTKTNGHGFGLHSSANYMTEMGGRMWAESAGRGQGATFVLSFPIAGIAQNALNDTQEVKAIAS